MHGAQRCAVVRSLGVALFLLAAAGVARAADAEGSYTFSYYANGRICVDSLGHVDGSDPATVPPGRGQEDFKPSWSTTGDRLVFFRRVKNDPVVTNWKTILCVIANKEYKPAWFAYPRWTRDGRAVIYHANTTGKGELFLYRLEDGSTARASTNRDIDYRYPHGQGAPK